MGERYILQMDKKRSKRRKKWMHMYHPILMHLPNRVLTASTHKTSTSFTYNNSTTSNQYNFNCIHVNFNCIYVKRSKLHLLNAVSIVAVLTSSLHLLIASIWCSPNDASMDDFGCILGCINTLRLLLIHQTTYSNFLTWEHYPNYPMS